MIDSDAKWWYIREISELDHHSGKALISLMDESRCFSTQEIPEENAKRFYCRLIHVDPDAFAPADAMAV